MLYILKKNAVFEVKINAVEFEDVCISNENKQSNDYLNFNYLLNAAVFHCTDCFSILILRLRFKSFSSSHATYKHFELARKDFVS